jgi:hypothetical protein
LWLLLMLLLHVMLLLLLLGMLLYATTPQQQDFGLANVEVLPRCCSKPVHDLQKRWHIPHRGQIDLSVISKLSASQADTHDSHTHPFLL